MTLRVAVIGAGYWGPNLVRNFRGSADWRLVAVCDLDAARAAKVVGDATGVDVMTSLDDLLARDDVDAVAIATPANTHRPIAMAALAAGKHVLVEKPLAATRDEARGDGDRAPRARAWSSCATTPTATPRSSSGCATWSQSGELGDILFIDSVRINLGLVQPDVDVIWDLAPHDLSILDSILPGGLAPEGVAAHGADPHRRRPGLHRLPHHAARGRGDGPRPRQLAEPDQDPPDGHRRHSPHRRVGRPQPPAAAQRLRPGRRPRPRRRGATTSRTAPPRASPTGSATCTPRRCRRRRPSAAWSPSSPPPSPRAGRRSPTVAPACASWMSSRRPPTSLAGADGGADGPPRRDQSRSWRSQCHEYVPGSPRARHRRSRNDRLYDRRPAARGGRRPTSTVLDNLVRGRRENLEEALRLRAGRPRRGRPARPRPGPRPHQGQ